MDRVFESGASATPPAPPVSPSSGYPTAGNPSSGTPATKPGRWWYYMITEELRKVIADAGITPDHTSVVQLKAALDSLYSAQGTVLGAFRNLALSATGTNANVEVSADEVALEDAGNKYATARAVALTISTAASGANGLDTGTIATSTWYSVWVIRKADGTTAGLLSTSATAPTLPTGYTFKARVGWIRTDGTANKYPLGFTQKGRRVQYLVAAGTNVTALPVMSSGIQGSPTTPTWQSVAWANFAPPTAAAIDVVLAANVGTAAEAAPNNGFGAYTSSSNPPPLMVYGGGGSAGVSVSRMMVPESSNLYWASNGAGCVLACGGWEDQL